MSYDSKIRKLEKKYSKKVEEAKLQNKEEELINKLHSVRKEVETKNAFMRLYDKLGFTKVLVIYVQLNAIIVQIWAMYEIHRSMDLSALPYLITAIIAEAIGLVIYFVKKSTAENTEGGIIHDLAVGKSLDNDPFSTEDELDVGTDGDR